MQKLSCTEPSWKNLRHNEHQIAGGKQSMQRGTHSCRRLFFGPPGRPAAPERRTTKVGRTGVGEEPLAQLATCRSNGLGGGLPRCVGSSSSSSSSREKNVHWGTHQAREFDGAEPTTIMGRSRAFRSTQERMERRSAGTAGIESDDEWTAREAVPDVSPKNPSTECSNKRYSSSAQHVQSTTGSCLPAGSTSDSSECNNNGTGTSAVGATNSKNDCTPTTSGTECPTSTQVGGTARRRRRGCGPFLSGWSRPGHTSTASSTPDTTSGVCVSTARGITNKPNHRRNGGGVPSERAATTHVGCEHDGNSRRQSTGCDARKRETPWTKVSDGLEGNRHISKDRTSTVARDPVTRRNPDFDCSSKAERTSTNRDHNVFHLRPEGGRCAQGRPTQCNGPRPSGSGCNSVPTDRRQNVEDTCSPHLYGTTRVGTRGERLHPTPTTATVQDTIRRHPGPTTRDTPVHPVRQPESRNAEPPSDQNPGSWHVRGFPSSDRPGCSPCVRRNDNALPERRVSICRRDENPTPGTMRDADPDLVGVHRKTSVAERTRMTRWAQWTSGDLALKPNHSYRTDPWEEKPTKENPPLHSRMMTHVQLLKLIARAQKMGIATGDAQYAHRLLTDESLYVACDFEPDATEFFGDSRLSDEFLQTLLGHRTVEQCPAPKSGGRATTTLEHIGQPKERYRFLGDMLHLNLFGPDSPKLHHTPMSQWIYETSRVAALFGVSIDMEKWYYQFELGPAVRKYHCFRIGDKWYQMTVLPMGVRSACWIADTIMRLIAELARRETSVNQQAKDLVDVYIDNVAYIAPERQVRQYVKCFRDICTSIGATVGDIEMGPVITHRGVTLNLAKQCVTLKRQFVQKFQRRCEIFNKSPTPDRIESLLGMCVYADSSLPCGLAPFRPYLYSMRWLAHLRRSQLTGGRKVDCPTTVRAEVTRWSSILQQLQPQSTCVPPPPAEALTIATDASKWGWGMSACIGGILYEHGEPWTTAERQLHINVLEILGAARTAERLQQMENMNRPLLVNWLMDNTTALSVVMNRGSRIIQLHEIAERFVKTCGECQWVLRPQYVQSAQNTADAASRNLVAQPTSRRLPVPCSTTPTNTKGPSSKSGMG